MVWNLKIARVNLLMKRVQIWIQSKNTSYPEVATCCLDGSSSPKGMACNYQLIEVHFDALKLQCFFWKCLCGNIIY